MKKSMNFMHWRSDLAEPMKGRQLQETIEKLNAKLYEIGSPETLTGLDKLFMVESGEPILWYAHASAPWPLPVDLTDEDFDAAGETPQVPAIGGSDEETDDAAMSPVT